MDAQNQQLEPLSGYQKFVIFLIAITQFTVVLDFMIMSPLGDMMMKTLGISTAQFGVAVSAYAFSAGASGLLTAGFADRYDRKKLLLFFYIGFALGTFFCGLAPNYQLLIAARIITGIFGGVIGSISMAIIADLFTLQQRGKVMGFVQMGFGVSQILGIPIGLYIANSFGWQAPFLWIAIMTTLIILIIFLKLKPIMEHLVLQKDHSPLKHLLNTLAKSPYRMGFLATAMLSIGGFMMMPFGSAFAINNVKVTQNQLPLLFMVTGLSSLISMPLIGRMSSKGNKLRIFIVATVLAIIIVNIYAHYSETPFWIVLITNVCMMVSIMSRIIPASVLTSAIPETHDRGAYMSVNSSLQQMAGGFGAMLGGFIIFQKDKFSPLEHYDTLAMVASAIMLITVYLVYRVNNLVTKK